MSRKISRRKDIVLFRVWKPDKYDDPEIIALFPEQEGPKPGLVGSYMHIGQHGDVDYFLIMDESRPAKMFEYVDLKDELESIGYNLRVVTRGASYLWWRQ
jgi:hypothetical protein